MNRHTGEFIDINGNLASVAGVLSGPRYNSRHRRVSVSVHWTGGNEVFGFDVEEARAVLGVLSACVAEHDAEQGALRREYGPTLAELRA